MARDSSGNYSLPVGNPVAAGDVIEADWANTTMADLAAALTDSLSRTGKGGMQTAFKNADGTVAAPGMSWTNEPTSGWYRKALNEFWYSVGNEDVFRITKAGIELAPGKTAVNISLPPVTISDAPPSSPRNGDEWYESDSGGLYMRYQNPDLTFTWILVSGASTGNYVPQTDKGIANGVATLDSGTKVPAAQLPSSAFSSVSNLLINGNFAVNQRAYVSGAATSGANQYTLDRWRVVTSGQNLTFAASGNGNQITAPAGGVEQVIEDKNVSGGTYTLSWTGTATATVNGSSVANGATVVLTANTAATVRFTSGTVSEAQFELGSVASPFQRRAYGQELMLCQRYYYEWAATGTDSAVCVAQAYSASDFTGTFSYPVTMRTAPSLTLSAAADFRTLRANASGTDACSALAVGAPSSQGTLLNCTSANLVAGNAVRLTAANANARLKFSAEL